MIFDASLPENPLRPPNDSRLHRIAGPSALVIFGATGDLARKKLMPAVYDLANRGLLSPGFALVGMSRRDWAGDVPFSEVVREAVQAHARTEFREETWEQLQRGIRFVEGDFDDPEAYVRLRETVEALDDERGTMGNHAFYLSIPPRAFPVVATQLTESGLVSSQSDGDRWSRVVIEKPFGNDLASARELNGSLEEAFPADSIFRIDHYLGKETVQNILALRFANELYEPIWNRDHIDHVQITMAEDIGVAGRAGYYDGVGAARDVIQNHLLQLLALTAMEEPISMSAEHLRAEKEKTLAAVSLPDDLATATARGQYGGGWQGGEQVTAFLDEDGMDPSSATETYAAVKLNIGTRRWAGVPFYLRTGKRLGRRVTEIAVVFRHGPEHLFARSQSSRRGQNALVIRIQPDEGVTLRFGSKVPGNGTRVRDVTMDFGYGHAFTEASPEAYERLILDVLLGDPPLFPRHEEVELSWRILDPIEQYWAAAGAPLEQYEPGSWGPPSADALLARDGRVWRRP
ncbi:glucose-6-phosphate dehydrogenase [Microbacterium betulae]|uniref:Glucose-6-phosphate 1-dehydrogenase n=1 Tax=Microbacterium betulae TaxID=2981139 RepID=A0AA97FFQ2_9MICO|nr:glucose-6-phosphate dehydrogenase [Microbacterium sp. AB]WOF22328.1 glucose-6-phosphate dehydrogenase [Microbacterium sp. AB]